MSGISFSGLGSGIDFDQLRASLIQIDQQSGLKFITKEKELNSKTEALKDIRTRMTTLATDIKALMDKDAKDLFLGVKSSSSNSSVFTATADSTAPAGTYDIKVQKMARSDSVISKTGAAISSFTSSYTGSDLNVAIENGITLLASLHRRDNGANFATADLGQFTVDDGATGPITLDLGALGISESSTVGDMISAINTALGGSGSGASVALNAAGNGLLFSSTTGNIAIADAADGKTTATKFGIATAGSVAAPVDGGDLDPDLQLDNSLAVLNGGAGVTDLSSGVVLKQGTSSLNLALTGSTTIGDVVSSVNGAGMSINASIAAGGKGLQIASTIDNRSLGILENGGTTASDLGLFGESNVVKIKTASESGYTSVYVNGAADGTDSSLSAAEIRDGINAAGKNADFSASVVDGRLMIRSKSVGTANTLQFEDSAADNGMLEQLGILISDPIDLSTISTAYAGDNSMGGRLQSGSDAVFSVDGIVVSRSKNTGIDDVIDGVSIDLVAPSESTGANFPDDFTAATLTVTRDDGAIADAMQKIVNQYNSTVELISELTKNDPDGKSGVLRTSSFARGISDGLFGEITSQASNNLNLAYSSLFELRDEAGNYAFKVAAQGSGKIDFNRAAFIETLENDREGVEALIRYDSDSDGAYDEGIIKKMSDFVEKYTSTFGGLISSQLSTYDLQIELNSDALERFEDRLRTRDAQLKRQFTATEKIISGLQSQSNYLSQQLARLG